jgi:hypothetical protein
LPRLRHETEAKLRHFLEEACKLYTKTALKNERTETGIKDTYQEFFLERLFSSYKDVSGKGDKQKALDAAVASLPEKTTSPVWRIAGESFDAPVVRPPY